MAKCKSWKELHKTINSGKKFSKNEKEADKMLVFEWGSFKKIKGKTMGDVKRKTLMKIGVGPSFLAVAYRRNACGAEKYINAKYKDKFD